VPETRKPEPEVRKPAAPEARKPEVRKPEAEPVRPPAESRKPEPAKPAPPPESKSKAPEPEARKTAPAEERKQSPSPAPAAPAAEKPETKETAKPAPQPEAPMFGALGGRPAAAEKPATLSTTETPAEAAGPLAGKTGWIAGAAAVLVLCVALFVYPGFLVHHASKPAAPPPVARQDSSPLSLRVERTANELLLTWSRDAEAIQNARSAKLSISDGERHENYNMNLEELRTGRIFYVPVTPDVSFRMEVMDQNNRTTASELVRVLRTSPMPDEAGAKPGVSTTPAETPAEPAQAQPQPTPRTPTKAFKMVPLAQRLRPAPVEDLPEAPSIGQAPAGQPALNLGAVAPMAAPPVSAPVAQPAQSERKAAPAQAAGSPIQGGRVQSGQLIFRKEPEYPRLARQSGVKGQVEVEATVGVDGRVKSVKVISGHTMLQKPAIDAVLQWVYRPTLLNGKPVESQTRIVLNFVGAR
jgi:protein TonB